MTDTLRELPLREAHERAGARWAPFAGWNMPLQYTGIVQEHRAVRTHAGIFDVSHMGRVEVHGSDAGARIRGITTANVTRLEPGRSRYTLYCTESGGIADDVIAYRLAPDRWLLVHNADNARADADRVRSALGDAMTDIAPDTAMLAVQGPEAAAVLRSVLGIDLATFARHGCVEIEWHGGRVFFGRTGYTGEDGGECITDHDRARQLWDAFLAAGVVPAGLGARDTLRLEAALPLHGHDISPETHPYEAGLGWAVSLQDGAPFTGRDALVPLAAREPERRLSCVRLLERGVPRAEFPVLDPARPAAGPMAHLSSGAFSPTLEAGIGMAYLPAPLAVVGTPLAIEIRGRAIPAEVVARPFYQRPS
ncbi:MAG: glycine cleavage system aminomethyltransferase GcvT [Dehalococcoidia bacterium]